MTSTHEAGQVRRSTRGRRTRLIIVVAVAFLALISVAALSPILDRRDSVELIYPNPSGGWGEFTVPNYQRGKLYAFTGAMTVCLSKPGSVVIESVRGYGGNGGVVVTRVVTRPARAHGEPVRNGDARGPLELLGFDTKPPIKVTTPCADDPQTREQHPEQHLTELGMEYKRVSDHTGSVEGFILTYSDGVSKKRELDIRFVMTLCASGDQSTPGCESK
jgi:hypothetical protein